MRVLILLSLCAASVLAAEKAPENPRSPFLVVGISPFLEKENKDDVYRGLVRLLLEDVPLGGTVVFYDAFHLRSITEVVLPNRRAFSSPKTRANQFAPSIRSLKEFLATQHPKPGQELPQFDGAICLPQLREFLEQTLPNTNAPIPVLLIGSPLYQDPKEPGFSMRDGYFPSDGHLRATSEQSVFGRRSGAGQNRILTVHWVYFGDPWVSDLHKEKVTRFWSLFFARDASQLATFSSDLTTVLRAFPRAATDAMEMTSRWTIDPGQTKIEMLRAGRRVEVVDWIARETVPELAQAPPNTMNGPMKIGIRWSAPVDLDLYATPRRGAETLFFERPRSAEGYYYKDHRSSPGREFEFIEFETPVDAREVEASVNFYLGTCPGGAQGEVRIEFDGRIYSAPFSIPASRGNRGRSGKSQQEFWVRIPVLSILKIPAGG